MFILTQSMSRSPLIRNQVFEKECKVWYLNLPWYSRDSSSYNKNVIAGLKPYSSYEEFSESEKEEEMRKLTEKLSDRVKSAAAHINQSADVEMQAEGQVNDLGSI